MVEMIEPHGGKVFDPACGSGGMFVQSAHFIAEHQRELEHADADVFVYGQEKTIETVDLAKMNLAVNGLRGEIKKANTYYEDAFGSPGAFDYVLANPPFNVDDEPGKQAVKGLVAQWAGLEKLQGRWGQYRDGPDGRNGGRNVDAKNKAQRQLREAIDPFFAALHENLRQLDKIVRQHERQQAEHAHAWSWLFLTLFQPSTVDFASLICNGSDRPYAVWNKGMERMKMLRPEGELLRKFETMVGPILDSIVSFYFIQQKLVACRDLLIPRLLSGRLSVEHLDIRFPPGMVAEEV